MNRSKSGQEPRSSAEQFQVMSAYGRGDGAVELALFERMARQDAKALNELYAIYANPLYSYAYKMLNDQQDSEEVLQDTFVRLWKKAPKYDAEVSKPFTWTVMILRGLCMDRLRKRSRRAHMKQVELAEDHATSPGTEGIERLFYSEITRKVRRALAALPEHESECLELAIFGDITHLEIAGQLDQPLGTVKSRIRRGMVKLRQLLKDIND